MPRPVVPRCWHWTSSVVLPLPPGCRDHDHAEGYFSQSKQSIDGIHHNGRREHLPRYMAQFDHRYSPRKLSGRRMRRLIDQAAGRRLSSKPLMGKD